MTQERCEQPKPAYHSLPNAIRAAIREGNTLANINLLKWCETYDCELEPFRECWERIQSEMSLMPGNAFEEHGK